MSWLNSIDSLNQLFISCFGSLGLIHSLILFEIMRRKVLPSCEQTFGVRGTRIMTLLWLVRSSTVKNQIPSTIWEAECTSTFCSGLNPGHKDASDLNSVPIHQNILVLERQHNSRCYTASYRSVVVGCTCVRAATNHAWTTGTSASCRSLRRVCFHHLSFCCLDWNWK